MGKRQQRDNFTAGRVAAFTCPPNKQQAIYWDGKQHGLGLRLTATGARAYIFESRLKGRTVRVTIGSPDAWPLESDEVLDRETGEVRKREGARQRAAALMVLIDQGINPAEQRREREEAKARAKAEREADDAAKAQREAEEQSQREQDEVRRAVTLADAWAAYLADRRPHWSDLHYRDHVNKARPGGEDYARRTKKPATTKPGPLAALMPLPLHSLDAGTVEQWAANEGKTRPASARLAWRLLTVFLAWCREQPQYAAIVPATNPAKTRRAREALGKPAVKSDVLTREQLQAWFAAVQSIRNKTAAAALQVMLLTGARPGEVLTLRWEDVNTRWRGLNIRDKVEGGRVIPLTPYVWHLLNPLPRGKGWVFASSMKAEKSGGRMVPPTPSKFHGEACAAAGIEGLTMHGLRRSFASLTEWLEIPAGVVAQIQGHKPSATAEKHYKRRPLDLLRMHHERIEAWMLKQAGIAFTPPGEEKSRLPSVA
jgi:integrase